MCGQARRTEDNRRRENKQNTRESVFLSWATGGFFSPDCPNQLQLSRKGHKKGADFVFLFLRTFRSNTRTPRTVRTTMSSLSASAENLSSDQVAYTTAIYLFSFLFQPKSRLIEQTDRATVFHLKLPNASYYDPMHALLKKAVNHNWCSRHDDATREGETGRSERGGTLWHESLRLFRSERAPRSIKRCHP